MAKKMYVGHLEFKITDQDIQNAIKAEVDSQLRYERNRLGDEIKAIRNLQKRMCKVEMKLDTKEVKKNSG
jgi:hypothetical protein